MGSLVRVTMNSLRVVYYITVYLLVYNDATEDQSIQIYPTNSNFRPSYVVLANTSQLYFKNFYGKRIDCTYGDKKSNYETQDHFTNGILKMLFGFTKFMSTVWECTGYDGDDAITIKYIFEIRLKGAEKVNVTISGEYVDFKSTNLSVKEYDGIHEHACEEGDTIDLICENPHGKGHIQLKYYDANGLIIFETNPTADRSLSFRKLVRDENVNGSYIECSYITPIIDKEETFTYRVIFTVISTTPKNSGIIVTINDVKLSAMCSNTNGNKYEYKFVKWIPVKLTCENKDQDLQDAIYGNITNKNNVELRVSGITSPSKYSATIETKNLDGAIFQCYSGSKSMVSITFSEDPYRDPFIQGLLANNILYQYNTGNFYWITHYRFEIKDVLNLTCFTGKDRQLEWVYDKEINTSMTQRGAENNGRFINNYFQINDNFTKSISCESNKSTTETRNIKIFLHNIPGSDKSDFVYNPDGDSNKVLPLAAYEIIGIVAGVVVTVVAVACVFYGWRSRRLIVMKQEAPYKSFNQVDDHEYTYIQNEYDRMKNEDSIMKANDLYVDGGLDNSCKTITTPIESHYTEIDIKTNPDGMSITYAVPYEIIKKNEPSASGKLYNSLQGEFENKNSNISNGNKVMKKDCSNSSYGNVGHINSPGYNNVIIYANK